MKRKCYLSFPAKKKYFLLTFDLSLQIDHKCLPCLVGALAGSLNGLNLPGRHKRKKESAIRLSKVETSSFGLRRVAIAAQVLGLLCS